MLTFKSSCEKETSWETIYRSKSSLRIGDELTCTLKDGITVTFVVAAINPYGDEQVAFVTKDCVGTHGMNSERKIKKDDGTEQELNWSNCDMRSYLNENILALLPDDLQAIIQTRKVSGKYRCTSGECHDILSFTTADKLWLLSRVEVYGGCLETTFEPNSIQFPLFKDRRNRIKCDEKGSETSWWLRSHPLVNRDGDFWYSTESGSANIYGYLLKYDSPLGVVFGFII